MIKIVPKLPNVFLGKRFAVYQRRRQIPGTTLKKFVHEIFRLFPDIFLASDAGGVIINLPFFLAEHIFFQKPLNQGKNRGSLPAFVLPQPGADFIGV